MTALRPIQALRLLLLVQLTIQGGGSYTLEETTAPFNANAGSAFGTQPMISIYDDDTGAIATSFVGDVYATILLSPTGFETLRFNKSTDSSTDNAVAFESGLATFNGLFVNEAGSGYTLRYIAREDYTAAIAMVDGQEFSVDVGTAYQIAFSTDPGSATGGSLISPQPVIEVQDVGGNLVSSHNDGSIVASILSGYNPTDAELMGTTTVAFSNGLATFFDLYIDEAGSPYILAFTYVAGGNGDLPGAQKEVYSNPFAVGIGPGFSLHLVEDPSTGYVKGGLAFEIPARVEVRDQGGNVLSSDSESAVECTFANNPSDGTLTPSEYTFQRLVQGQSIFTRIAIDNIGDGYILQFRLYTYNSVTLVYTATDVTVNTPSFNVVFGPPYAISVSRAPSGAWAGGTAFTSQPVVQLQDVGGNILTADSETTVSASVVASPSVDMTVAVATSGSPPVGVTRVYSPPGSVYTSGDQLSIFIEFDQEVTISAVRSAPVLHVNVYNATHQLYAVWLDTTGRSKTQHFRFNVPGELSPMLRTLSHSSTGLCLRDSTMLDNLGRIVNVTLPQSGNLELSNVTIDTRVPKIINMELLVQCEGVDLKPVLNKTDDHLEYASMTGRSMEIGAGHRVAVRLTFSDAVIVQGVPSIPLNVTKVNYTQSAYQNASRDFTKAKHVVRYAKYKHGSGTTELLFTYNTRLGDKTERLDMPDGDMRKVVTNNTDEGYLGYIYRSASAPTIRANLSLDHLGYTLGSIGMLTLDTAPPVVNGSKGGIMSAQADGLYRGGDLLYFDVDFNKEVVVTSGVYIALDSGPTAPASAYYYGGSGTNRLSFSYTVGENDETSLLNWYGTASTAIKVPSGEYIRRVSTNPIGDADVSVVNDLGLNETAKIALDGVAPTVKRFFFDHGSGAKPGQNKTYTVDDEIFINVSFSAPVVIFGTSKLYVDAENLRPAAYDAGNMTSMLRYKYIVMLGDSVARSTSTACGYCYDGSGLCSGISSCPWTIGLQYSPNALTGSIFLYSTNPTVSADLDLTSFKTSDPRAGSRYGLPIYSKVELTGTIDNSTSVFVDTSNVRKTTIVGISTEKVAGKYGSGEQIYFDVEFSDEVEIMGAELPRLRLNVGDYADYNSGSGGTVFQFLYTVKYGDNTSAIDWAYEPSDPTSFFLCNGTGTGNMCDLENNNGVDVNLTVPATTTSLRSGVRIDTSRPRVTRIYSTKNTSTYPGEVYTTGEAIDIIVEFDLPIYVQDTPLLYVSTSIDQTAATAVEFVDYVDEYSILFTYNVATGDMSHNLTFADQSNVYANSNNKYENALTNNFGQAAIFRDASVPTTFVNYSVGHLYNHHGPLNFAGPGKVIKMDTTIIPVVTNVTSPTPPGTYYPGDVIAVDVHLSQFVTFDSVETYQEKPFITLEVGAQDRKAVYISGDHTQVLRFEYTVRAGDVTYDLEYVDSHALETGLDDAAEPGLMLMKSTNPTKIAQLMLPYVGRPGSLSYNSNIRVDGSTPYITSIDILGEDGVSYTTGDDVDFKVSFSADVYVNGNPRIELHAADVQRYADFYNGTNTSQLLFRYVVQTGDETSRLDYFANERQFRSSVQSFDLSHGSILKLSSHPTLPVDVHINPAGGFLDGTTDVSASVGVATFEDLQIVQRGPDYLIKFESMPYDLPHMLTTETTIGVEYSSEFEITASDREPDDWFGHAVDIVEDVVMIGAPHKHLDIPEIQYVRTHAESSRETYEIQIVGISAIPQPEIQSFVTYSDPRTAVGGTFRLRYCSSDGTCSETRDILADAPAEAVSMALEESMPRLGGIISSRSAYGWCACENGFKWTITFKDAAGQVNPLVTLGADLTGSGATITSPETVQDSPFMNGTFTLSLSNNSGDPHYWTEAGDNLNNADPTRGPIGGDTSRISTRSLPVDAHPSYVSNALEEDLGLAVHSITSEGEDAQNGRKYRVTFANQVTGSKGNTSDVDNDVPELVGDSTGLGGHGANVWVHTARNGTNRLWGSFTLGFREEAIAPGHSKARTVPIRHDAPAGEMEAALEELGGIDDVVVSRGDFDADNGVVWIITFIEVRRYTPYGWIFEPMGNLEPLVPDQTHMHGTGVTVEVGHRHGGSMDYPHWAPKREGSYGEETGAVYFFERTGISKDQYGSLGKLEAEDADAYDHFGWSVKFSAANRRAVVGAPAKEDYGVLEQQEIRCTADGGEFYISYRGQTSDALSYNISHLGFVEALQSQYGPCMSCHSGATADPMHVFPTIEVAPWNGPLCNGSTPKKGAVITFITPAAQVASGDLELLQVDTAALVLHGEVGGGAMNVSEKVKGTAIPHGADAKGATKGAAYVFTAASSALNSWNQNAKLFLPNGGAADRFGWVVGMSDSTIVVSAPGEGMEIGAVYVFELTNNEWIRTQRLDGSVYSSMELDKFGEAMVLSADGNTLVIGSPGFSNGTGCAYVFRRSKYTNSFQIDQQLTLGRGIGIEGDRLGCAVAIDYNTAVVSACGRADRVVHTGVLPSPKREPRSGAVYVYLRGNTERHFFLSQRLVASNVKAHDHFGHSVAISNDTIVASSLTQMPSGARLRPRHAVHAITTSARSLARDPSAEHIGSTFRLAWKYRMIEKDKWTRRVSSPIKSTASASDLAALLEQEFGIGYARVSRTAVDPNTGGYTWYVTFADINAAVPLLEADGSTLTGADASVEVIELNSTPEKVRGVVHAFTRPSMAWRTTGTDNWEEFVEQTYLYPAVKQRQDLFGSAVAVSGDVAVVGAKNRDSYVSFKNGGAAFAYNLDFLRFAFSEETYEVYEGEAQTLALQRSTGVDTLQVLKLVSLDRNVDVTRQAFARDLFDLDHEVLPMFTTVTDRVGAGSAFARAQYYGSPDNKSIWVDSQYDYDGVSDYLPINDPLVIYSGQEELTYVLNTTNDALVEVPDENLTVMLQIPGMWSSPLGDINTQVVILDDADGTGDVWSVACFDKIHSETIEQGDEFGKAVAVDDADDIAVVGSPYATRAGGDSKGGAAYAFRRKAGVWEQEDELRPKMNGSNAVVSNAYFGEAVAVKKTYGRNHTTILVGAPGIAKVFVYDFNLTWAPRNRTRVPNLPVERWAHVATLSHPEAKYAQHRFGARGSIAIDQDMAVIGAYGLECVFIFRRLYDERRGEWVWQEGQKLVSSDYDFDFILDRTYMHKQHFGVGLGLSKRTIAVGAPYADYGNLGETFLREAYDTNGVYNPGMGRGKVYIFYSIPSQQTIQVRADTALYEGTFRLRMDYRNVTLESGQLAYDASADEVKAAIELLATVDEVDVVYEATALGYKWTVSFLSENVDPPLLEPVWRSSGCGDCTNFSSTWSGSLPQMFAQRIVEVGDMVEQTFVQAEDRNSGNLFGVAIGLHYDALIVGAPYSSVLTTTTWDFETGDLIGWHETGNAFDYQPTWGDNPMGRSVYGGAGDRRSYGREQKTGLRGRYFIGTFERRPGNGRNDYINAHPDYTMGTSQGDAPIGVLTSQTFVILGSRISFLVGGGCDSLVVYVELLVDGVGVDRATGECREMMRNVTWDVALYHGRAAQIRIVDAGTSIWGHINVDHFVFDWVMTGGYMDRAGQKVHRAMQEATPKAGAAYTFRRHDNVSTDFCTGDKQYCSWSQESKLMASDRRAGDLLGSSVSVNDVQGTALVGAPGAAAMSMYKTTPANNPHYPGKATSVEIPIGDFMAKWARSGGTQTLLPNAMRQVLQQRAVDASSATAVTAAEDVDTQPDYDDPLVYDPRAFDDREYAEAGAMYVFRRNNIIISAGVVLEVQNWPPTEQMKLVPPALRARDGLGTSVALSGVTAFGGANGDDGMGNNAGTVYQYDIKMQRVYFDSAEYYATEGDNSDVTITISRDADYIGHPLTVAYATSDLTAKGIDPLRYADCLSMPVAAREGCGDYVQTSGEVTFAVGDSAVNFVIDLVNDFCKEHYSEYVQLTLSIPGSTALGGEEYYAKLRIDDDDFTYTECTHEFL